MTVPSEDVVDAACSDELYLGFVWNDTRKILSGILFFLLFGMFAFSHPLDTVRIQIGGVIVVLIAILSTGKTYHFDAKNDLFRYHQTFMLLSLSWVEAGRVSEMRAARFVTREVVDSESGQVSIIEELKLLYKHGEPFHFVSIFGRGHLEVIAAKINRFLFNNREHNVDVILKSVGTASPEKPEVMNSTEIQHDQDGDEPSENNTFW